MADFNTIPRNPYGKWKESILMDKDIRQEIEAHLHSLGPFISAMDIVEFLNTLDMCECLGCDKPISLRTGQHWLKTMGYCWKREKKGQYSDGHEREDVVKYWQHVFLPVMAKYGETTRNWNEGGEVITEPNTGRHTVVWVHDKSIFYAHDCRKVCWVHDSETVKPYAKGEGPSVMVADFVSADYGWLKGGNHVAQVLLSPGSNCDGYFTNDDVIGQVSNAMRILTENYPDDDHVLVSIMHIPTPNALTMPCQHSRCQRALNNGV